MADHIVLSISMLASRKKEQVQRCLDSLCPIMEQLPCELILVDTSKDEAVHQMLLTYSDKVVEFDWCNDFSKARNAGLALAGGEWFLYIDDDEWFEDAGELIRFFESGEYKNYGCANYIQRNYHDPKLIHYSDAWASRMIRIGKETHFRSKIHEYLYPQEGECKNLHVIVGHTGYIYLTDKDRAKHFERNYPLLLDMMKEEPQRLRWRVHIVQEFHAVKRWEELLAFCTESLKFCRDRNDEWDNRDIGTFYAGAVESALNLGAYDQAEQLHSRMKKDSRCSELCHAYTALLMAQVCFRQSRWEQAQSHLDEYYRQKAFLESHRRKLEIQEGALVVEAAFDSILVKRAASLLIGCALMRGDTSVMRDMLDQLEWDQPVIYVSDDFFPTLIERMASLPQDPVFVRAMQYLWNNAEMQRRMFVAIQEWEEKSKEGFVRLLRIAAQVEGAHWYLWYARILVAGMDDNPAHVKEDFEGYCRNTPNVFMTPETVKNVLNKFHVSVEEGYLAVPFEKWDAQLIDYIAKAPLGDLLLTEQELTKYQTRESVHFRYAFMRIAEAKAVHSKTLAKYDGKRAYLQAFAQQAEAFARRYYRPEAIERYPELLPDYVHAGLLLGQAFLVEEKEAPTAAQLQRNAAETDTIIADAVRSYMQAHSDEQQRRARESREEMRRLERQIKKRVEQCLETGQYEAALGILAQLKQMRPNDLDVAEMTLRARLGILGRQPAT